MDDQDRFVEVFVETPQGSRKKYEYDHDLEALRLDRRLFSATVFPVDYGFIPHTRGQDGEPLDALVVTDEPTFPGCWVTGRVIGVFWIRYGDAQEAKIVCVPEGDPTWRGVEDLDDLAEHLKEEISHFFEVYKQLEPGQNVSPAGYEGRAAALKAIEQARQNA